MEKIIVSVLVFKDENHILLIKENGRWFLPEGKEKPEDKGNPVDAAKRIVLEKTGLFVDIRPRLKFVELKKDTTYITYLGYLALGRSNDWYHKKAIWRKHGIFPPHRQRAKEVIRRIKKRP